MADEQAAEPEGIPEGCVYFGKDKLLDDICSREGEPHALYLATLDLGEISLFCPGGGRDGHDTVMPGGRHVRKLYAMVRGGHNPEALQTVMKHFGESTPERIYDGLSEGAARMIVEGKNIRLPLEDLDALLVKPEYLPAPSEDAAKVED